MKPLEMDKNLLPVEGLDIGQRKSKQLFWDSALAFVSPINHLVLFLNLFLL